MAWPCARPCAPPPRDAFSRHAAAPRGRRGGGRARRQGRALPVCRPARGPPATPSRRPGGVSPLFPPHVTIPRGLARGIDTPLSPPPSRASAREGAKRIRTRFRCRPLRGRPHGARGLLACSRWSRSRTALTATPRQTSRTTRTRPERAGAVARAVGSAHGLEDVSSCTALRRGPPRVRDQLVSQPSQGAGDEEAPRDRVARARATPGRPVTSQESPPCSASGRSHAPRLRRRPPAAQASAAVGDPNFKTKGEAAEPRRAPEAINPRAHRAPSALPSAPISLLPSAPAGDFKGVTAGRAKATNF